MNVCFAMCKLSDACGGASPTHACFLLMHTPPPSLRAALRGAYEALLQRMSGTVLRSCNSLRCLCLTRCLLANLDSNTLESKSTLCVLDQQH